MVANTMNMRDTAEDVVDVEFKMPNFGRTKMAQALGPQVREKYHAVLQNEKEKAEMLVRIAQWIWEMIKSFIQGLINAFHAMPPQSGDAEKRKQLREAAQDVRDRATISKPAYTEFGPNPNQPSAAIPTPEFAGREFRAEAAPLASGPGLPGYSKPFVQPSGGLGLGAPSGDKAADADTSTDFEWLNAMQEEALSEHGATRDMPSQEAVDMAKMTFKQFAAGFDALIREPDMVLDFADKMQAGQINEAFAMMGVSVDQQRAELEAGKTSMRSIILDGLREAGVDDSEVPGAVDAIISALPAMIAKDLLPQHAAQKVDHALSENMPKVTSYVSARELMTGIEGIIKKFEFESGKVDTLRQAAQNEQRARRGYVGFKPHDDSDSDNNSGGRFDAPRG